MPVIYFVKNVSLYSEIEWNRVRRGFPAVP